MPFINIEIKARTNRATEIREYLLQNGASFKGTDQQTDTYFNTKKGRLKLREGAIENNLIYYERENQAGPKKSDFELMPVSGSQVMKRILTASMGILAVVEKKREIYYINNVKFHIDEVINLGSFVEIEAGNISNPELTTKTLRQQCHHYMKEFGISDSDLVESSYSDLVLAR